MKNFIKVLGVLGVFSLICGCSDDGSSHPLQPISGEESVDSSSSAKEKDASSSSKKEEGSKDASSSSKKSSDSKDTTTIHEQVIITSSGEEVSYTYYSSAVTFCWNEGCEAQFPPSSSSAAPASSESIVITVSSESSVPPEVNGDRMTDKRDNKSYKLQNVGSKLWMAENLKFETSNGSFCSTEGGEDHCAKYGRYYTYAAAKRACPSGWRLPKESEVLEADAIVDHKWWSVGGRFKVADGKPTEYGMDNEQGYIWTETNGENNSWRVKNYDGDEEHAMQSSSETERAYNVRCVQE